MEHAIKYFYDVVVVNPANQPWRPNLIDEEFECKENAENFCIAQGLDINIIQVRKYPYEYENGEWVVDYLNQIED